MFQKQLKALAGFLLFSAFAFAQLNVSFVSQVNYNEDSNDIWGYAAPNGDEYALVGLRNGLSIVSLVDPANPVEVAYVGGASSTWRDIKTWSTYAYVTNEEAGGLLVVDLSNLPTSINSYYWQPVMNNVTLETCHNIFIDEFGVAYLAGCNTNGGVTYIDVATDPYNPSLIDYGPSDYSHDIYVRDNILYSSEIYNGYFAIYDVTNKNNTVFLNSQQTPFNFTHNAWLSDDSQHIYTTDETADAPIGSYNISDFNDIQLVDEFRPNPTIGDGVIPHNVHVWDDYIIISYYTDGCIIVDAARPDNLIEVGNFDTFIPASTGFSGAWGAYPFLPSGLILVSDIGQGLYVLQPNYVRACYLEGVITNAVTSAPINGATAEILTTLENDLSDNVGIYKTGIATSGTYTARYSAPGFEPAEFQVTLSNGVVTVQDAALNPIVPITISGQVINAADGTVIPNAEVQIVNDTYDFNFTTGIDGSFTQSNIYTGLYTIYAGKWGYSTVELTGESITSNSGAIVIELEEGYQDPFAMDLGWSVFANAETGNWLRTEPDGISQQGTDITPSQDSPNDIANQCYMTGYGAPTGSDDVDNGITTLTSPVFDIADYNEARVSYETWFVNYGGNGDPNDALEIRLTNGLTSVTLQTITGFENTWTAAEFVISDYITPTDNMRIIFETSDMDGSGHIVKALVDNFKAWDADPTIIDPVGVKDQGESVLLNAYPNPFENSFLLDYDLKGAQNAQLSLYNILGKEIYTERLQTSQGQINLGEALISGVYLLEITNENGLTETLKLVKR